jgi:hypothetical protein
MSRRDYYRDLARFPSRRGRTFHHFHYGHLKWRRSIYWLDGVYLPGWAHVSFVHTILGGSSRAGSQPFGKFPNLPQRLAHLVFRVVFVIF